MTDPNLRFPTVPKNLFGLFLTFLLSFEENRGKLPFSDKLLDLSQCRSIWPKFVQCQAGGEKLPLALPLWKVHSKASFQMRRLLRERKSEVCKAQREAVKAEGVKAVLSEKLLAVKALSCKAVLGESCPVESSAF